MHTVANDIRLSYELSGRNDAPVVVLSHSLGSSSIMWDPQLTALEADYRVLRFDTRGHGESEATDGPYTLDMLGDDAIALLDALDIGQVHWVGLSKGGMIGQNVALRAPARLRSLALCDTMALVPEDAQPVWQERIDVAGSQGMEPLADPTMERWFTPPFHVSDAPAVARIRDQFVATPVAGYVGCCHAIRALDYLDSLSALSLPVLVMVGEHDPATPVEASRAMHAAMPGSDLAVIPSAAHLSNMEQPARFNRRLLEFLASA